MTQLDIHDTAHVFAGQTVEQNDLVQAIEEFRPKMMLHHGHDIATGSLGILAIAQGGKMLCAQVGGQDDDGVGEIDGAALTVGHAAIVQHLQQHVEYIGVGFFHLVEQHHLIGPPPHRLGQGTAFIIADVSGRCANQAGHGVLLHIFRHVNAGHGDFIIEQEFRQGLAQFSLAYASGAQEQEGTDGAGWILQPGAGPAHGVGDSGQRLLLTDHAAAKTPFHRQQFVPFAGQHFLHRDTCPAGHDGGDVFFAHDLAQHC